MLARNGAVSLINNVLNAAVCGRPPRRTPTPTPTPTPGDGTTPGTGAGARPEPVLTARRGARHRPAAAQRSRADSRATVRRADAAACTDGFRATVRGRHDRARRLPPRRQAHRQPDSSPFRVSCTPRPAGTGVTARVTFKDATRAKTLTLRYRACAAPACSSPARARRDSPDEPACRRVPRPPGLRRGAPALARRRSLAAAPRVLVARRRRRPAPRCPRASRSWCCADHAARTRPTRTRARIESVARAAAADRRPDRPSRARPCTTAAEGRAGCTSGSPGGRTDTRAGSARRPHEAHVHRVAHLAHALHPPGHGLPRRPGRTPLPRRRRQALDADADAAASSSRRRSRSRPPTPAVRSRWPPARARTSCRNSRAAPARSRSTGPTGSRARSAPRRRTGASGSARTPSPGWPDASAAAFR